MRIDLAPASKKDLLKLLRRFRNSYDLMAVKCNYQHVASAACRDSRVDLVYFDTQNPKVRFSHSLANQLNGAVEFNLIADLALGIGQDAVSRVMKDLQIAKDHKVPIVVSSRSTSVYDVRSPMQLVSVATTLGLPAELSRDAITAVPRSIILTDAQKRSRSYVEEGVVVVESRNGRSN